MLAADWSEMAPPVLVAVFALNVQARFHSVSGCSFQGNTAVFPEPGLPLRGGAVYVEMRTSVELTGCDFSENEASTEGGAIYVARDHFAAPEEQLPDMQSNTMSCNLPDELFWAALIEGPRGPEVVPVFSISIPCEPACPADISGDGQVGTPDLFELLAAWGACP